MWSFFKILSEIVTLSCQAWRSAKYSLMCEILDNSVDVYFSLTFIDQGVFRSDLADK